MARSLASIRLPLLAALLLLAGCGGDDEAASCGPDVEKRAIADLVYQWYLYPETLPEIVDTSQFGTAAEVLDYMTGPAQQAGLDRGWSYTTTVTAAQTYFEEGTSLGFGIGLLWRDTQLFVSQVYPGSAAADAGFARGDEILRVGESETTLAAVAPETLGAALGAGTAGITRVIEVRTQAGATVPRTVTKRTFGLDPVPAVDGAQRWKIVERNGTKLGYVALRTFIAPADPLLEQAFAAFRAQGVTDVAVDLRYNGGGLVSTGEHLANLLGGGLGGQPMMQTSYRPERALGNDRLDLFTALGSAIATTRIAFITTGSSASASEMVPNVLEPYRPGAIAFVGEKTYGKPVGQNGFRLRNCEAAAYLVSFRLENAQGDAGYFTGLPNDSFSGPLCPALDDVSRPLGDEAEASTAAALTWLETGGCPPAPVAKPGALRAAPARDLYPEAPHPTDAQRHVRGLF